MGPAIILGVGIGVAALIVVVIWGSKYVLSKNEKSKGIIRYNSSNNYA